MKSFGERNLFVIGLVGILALTGFVITAVNYQKLPFFSPGKSYSAYFAEAGGLAGNAEVQVSGLKAGQVTGIELDGQHAPLGMPLRATKFDDPCGAGDGVAVHAGDEEFVGAHLEDGLLVVEGGDAQAGEHLHVALGFEELEEGGEVAGLDGDAVGRQPVADLGGLEGRAPGLGAGTRRSASTRRPRRRCR